MADASEEDELFWRSVTVSRDDERWQKLADAHQNHFAPQQGRDVEIYWRNNGDGKYIFVFSPLAAIDALKGRLKGYHLEVFPSLGVSKLLEDGFSRTERVV